MHRWVNLMSGRLLLKVPRKSRQDHVLRPDSVCWAFFLLEKTLSFSYSVASILPKTHLVSNLQSRKSGEIEKLENV